MSSESVELSSVTRAELAQAFEKWEQDFRVHPDKLLSAEEVMFLGVSQVSAERADYFLVPPQGCEDGRSEP